MSLTYDRCYTIDQNSIGMANCLNLDNHDVDMNAYGIDSKARNLLLKKNSSQAEISHEKKLKLIKKQYYNEDIFIYRCNNCEALIMLHWEKCMNCTNRNYYYT
jgi:hypothetical protein